MFDQYLAHPIQSYISLQRKHIEFSLSLSVISVELSTRKTLLAANIVDMYD